VKTVLAHGCFDGLHPGHLRHLEEAKHYVDWLIVSITTDEWVRKGPGRPYIPAALRAELVGALRCVDQVVLTDGDSAAEVIRRLRPTFFAKGHDYFAKNDPRTRAEKDALASYGGLMLFTSGQIVFSSTVIFADRGETSETNNESIWGNKRGWFQHP
jgi:cytidyltransferase-like protein